MKTKEQRSIRLSGGIVLTAAVIRAIRDFGWAAYLLLWLAGTLAWVVATNNINHNAGVTNKAVQSECKRTNILRRSDNRNSLEGYLDEVLASKLTETTDPKLSRGFHKRSLERTWTPLTNCKSAFKHPDRFVTPNPRPIHTTPLHQIPT